MVFGGRGEHPQPSAVLFGDRNIRPRGNPPNGIVPREGDDGCAPIASERAEHPTGIYAGDHVIHGTSVAAGDVEKRGNLLDASG